MGMIENLEKMLAAGQDSALLRFSLGSAYLKAGDATGATTHLSQAVAQDPSYSAAWKLYGRGLTELGRLRDALDAYETGIRAAEEKGDKQAAKEMGVFLKRLRRELGDQR
jgi:Tfp pilus assembly protein PilF